MIENTSFVITITDELNQMYFPLAGIGADIKYLFGKNSLRLGGLKPFYLEYSI